MLELCRRRERRITPSAQSALRTRTQGQPETGVPDARFRKMTAGYAGGAARNPIVSTYVF